MIENFLQVVLGLGCEIALTIKRRLELSIADSAYLVHPFHNLSTVAVYELAERHIFFATAEQHIGKRPHIVAECLGNILRLDTLDAATLGVLCGHLAKTDSLSIIDIEHIDEDRVLHGVHGLWVNAKLLCVVNEVLFIGLLLLRQVALPQVTECIRAVVALNDLATSIDSRSAGICRYAAGDFFRTNTLSHFLCSEHRYSLSTIFGLCLLNKEHGVALSLHMGGLQLRSLNDSDTAFG